MKVYLLLISSCTLGLLSLYNSAVHYAKYGLNGPIAEVIAILVWLAVAIWVAFCAGERHGRLKELKQNLVILKSIAEEMVSEMLLKRAMQDKKNNSVEKGDCK